MDSNERIIEEFYNIYFRSPKLEELYACGGEYIRKGNYYKLLVSLGYPKVYRAETYEVVRIDNGEVVFIGTMTDIAEEYDGTRSGVRNTYARNQRFRCDYKLRLKPFDAELVRKELEKYDLD